jgi:hypothetical protein
MKPPSKQSNEQPTFLESYSRAKWFMQFPALTVMVLMRRDIGYRLLNPLKLIAVNGLLAVIGIMAQPGNEDARPIALTFFAAFSFCAGIVQRLRRWRELSQPARHHSEYVGTSPFEFRWLPAFMRRNWRMARFVDPLACILVGVALFPVSHALACYLVFAAFCLRAYGYQIFEDQRNRDLDLADGLVMAQYQSEVVEQYEDTAPPPQPGQARPGIPTGLGSDLQANLKRRKSSNPPPNS